MNQTDQEYFRLLNLILSKGRVKHNRTGIDTIGVFGAQARFPLNEGFPILTTKKVFFKAIVHELLWFIKGDTNIKYLVDNGVHIWDEWAYVKYKKALGDIIPMSQDDFIRSIKEDASFAEQHGDLGEGTYGGMWRNFPYYYPEYKEDNGTGFKGTVDQLQKVIKKLQTNPDDRRMIVSAWHPHWVDHCALPPCHCLFHFNTEELTHKERMEVYHQKKGNKTLKPFVDTVTLNESDIPKRRVNLLLYQRSCDTFLGVPFNISSYALLLAMVAHCVNMVPGEFVHTYGDLHLYQNSIDAAKLQLQRAPYSLPSLWLNPEKKDLFDFKYEDIMLVNYESHPPIRVEVAV